MTTDHRMAPNPNTQGILWMLATGIAFVAVAGLVRWIGTDMPPAEAGFLRYVLGLIFIIPALGQLRGAQIRRTDWGLFALRGFAQTMGVILWFYAMARLPVADVVAMGYLTPVWVTLGAALVLGERFKTARLAAIGVAFVGVLIILRPGLRALSDGYIAMLFVAPIFAISYLSAKSLTARHGAGLIVVMLSLAVPVVMAPFALAVWVAPTWPQLLGLFAVAGFATLGHYTMTRAFRAAPMAVTQPIVFFQLVWATLVGVLIFSDPFDVWVIVGGVVIVVAISVIAMREARQTEARKQAAIAPKAGFQP